MRDAKDPNNYRPISVLPILSKFLERHLHNHLYTYLNSNNLLYTRQSGIRRHHGTETALIRIIDQLLFSLDRNHVCGLVLIDYCKAFDMVDHQNLMKKLRAYGMDIKPVKWLESYLSGRTQFVSFCGSKSDLTEVPHGVPQGSILGPLFFVIFINDLPFHVQSSDINLDLYADDITLSFSVDVNDEDRVQRTLSLALSDVEHWTNCNKLPLNEAKTKTLLVTGKRLQDKVPPNSLSLVTSRGKALEQMDTVRLLGVDIDSHLSFTDHVERMCEKISQRIGVLNRIKACLPFKQRMLYYNAMIKPLFSYGSVAWQSRCSNVCISRIFRLRKRAARAILNRKTQAPTLPLFNKLKWLPFYTDTLISKCAILFKRIQLFVPDYLIEALKLTSSLHSRNNRFSKLNFLTPRYRLKTEGGRTFLVTAIEQWNMLGADLKKEITVKSFRRALHQKFLKNQQFLPHF